MHVSLQVLITPPRADLVDKHYSGHDSKRHSRRNKFPASLVGEKWLEYNQTRVRYDIFICSLLFLPFDAHFLQKNMYPSSLPLIWNSFGQANWWLICKYSNNNAITHHSMIEFVDKPYLLLKWVIICFEEKKCLRMNSIVNSAFDEFVFRDSFGASGKFPR